MSAIANGTGGSFEGTNTGWNNANNDDWTFESPLKFGANANGFILWLCTDTHRSLVKIHGNRTQDFGNNTFNVAHNHLDGQFHTFRVAHESVAGKYHVGRDGVRLTPVAGVAYDQPVADSRMIIAAATGDVMKVTLNATSPQRNYMLYKSANLGVSGAWTPVTGPVTGTDGALIFHDRISAARAFYRVEVSIP